MDVLVISDKKFVIEQKPLSVLVLSLDDVVRILEEDPIQLYPIILEAEPVVNAPLLEELKAIEMHPKAFLGLVKATGRKLEAYEPMIEEKAHLDVIVYPLVMRLRALYLIGCMLSKKGYTNAGFRSHAVSSALSPGAYDGLYRVYRSVRDNEPLPRGVVSLEDIRVLWRAVGRENRRLERRLHGKKK